MRFSVPFETGAVETSAVETSHVNNNPFETSPMRNMSKTRRTRAARIASIGRLAALAAACTLVARTALADPEIPGNRPAQWRVVWTADPAHEATLCWTTGSAGKKHRVHFKKAGGGKEGLVEGAVESYANGRYTVTGFHRKWELYYHHARITDLEPSTRYDVEFESDGVRSAPMWFLTAPDDERPLKILFGGDSRSGRDARQQINDMLARMVREDPSILALAHGGDYVASGTSLTQWYAWMADHERTVTAEGRLLPVIPARGNHDPGPLFNQVFGFKSGDKKNYYGMTLSPLVRLVTLNSNISTGGDQKKWLQRELQAARPAHHWLVAQYHRPAWPAVKEPGGAKSNWVPLFEKHDVDLACEADGHAIKRTVPIRNGKVDKSGVVYIGEGGLGVGQRSPKSRLWYLQEPGKSGKGHHVQVLAFTSEALDYQTILLDGSVFDAHRLPVRPAVAARRAAAARAALSPTAQVGPSLEPAR